MKLSYRVFWTPKSGSSAEEYEDAYAPDEAPNGELHEFRCAVADGATETSFSGLWAKMLCTAYIDKDFDLTQLQESWHLQVSGKELPWYAEEKLEAGAFATILGFSIFEDSKGLNWSARALGDSCFFHVRGGKIIKAGPLEKWEDFDYTPALLSTRQAANKDLLEKQEHLMGSCAKGDLFYLMTDAISKWFFRRDSDKGDAVLLLESIENSEQFENLVNEQRHLRDEQGRALMPNDDVTWTRIQIS